MLRQYLKLIEDAERMVRSGRHPLDPVVRSIYRKCGALYEHLSAEDKMIADFRDEIYLF